VKYEPPPGEKTKTRKVLKFKMLAWSRQVTLQFKISNLKCQPAQPLDTIENEIVLEFSLQ